MPHTFPGVASPVAWWGGPRGEVSFGAWALRISSRGLAGASCPQETEGLKNSLEFPTSHRQPSEARGFTSTIGRRVAVRCFGEDSFRVAFNRPERRCSGSASRVMGNNPARSHQDTRSKTSVISSCWGAPAANACAAERIRLEPSEAANP